MTATHDYAAKKPSRSEVDALPGPTLLEFGSPWCGHCRRAQPLIDAAFANHAGVRHIKVADASRRRLGRSFGVKLWPTLVFLKDGREAWTPELEKRAQELAEIFGFLKPSGEPLESGGCATPGMARLADCAKRRVPPAVRSCSVPP